MFRLVCCGAAGQLSMGGPGERARARQLLEQAVLLKQQFAGAPDHPGWCLFIPKGSCELPAGSHAGASATHTCFCHLCQLKFVLQAFCLSCYHWPACWQQSPSGNEMLPESPTSP